MSNKCSTKCRDCELKDSQLKFLLKKIEILEELLDTSKVIEDINHTLQNGSYSPGIESLNPNSQTAIDISPTDSTISLLDECNVDSISEQLLCQTSYCLVTLVHNLLWTS